MTIKRYKDNPILTAGDFVPCDENLRVQLVLNPGVCVFNGKVILLVRVAVSAKEREGFVGVPIYNPIKRKFDIVYFDKTDSSCDFSDVRLVRKNGKVYLTTLSYLALATSLDGVNFDVNSKPLIIGDNQFELYGVEDARITKIEDTYYINYSGVSGDGICTMLASTKDFETITKYGPIFLPDNKDVVIFPKKINDEYIALSRPESAYFKRPGIWMSYSSDLLCWGKHKLFMTLRENNFDSARIGASCVPFLTEQGWLEIYHGATIDNVYKLGAVLLDKNDPSVILARSEEAIMVPQENYEKRGFMPNVIFSCGCNVNGDEINLYYGACDQYVCYAKLSVSELISCLKPAK